MPVSAALKNLVKRAAFGETVIRDFMTVGIGDLIREKVYLSSGGTPLDVSGRQWLLGLDPRVLGVWMEKGAEAGAEGGGQPGADRCADRDGTGGGRKGVGYRMYFLDSSPVDLSRIARDAVAILDLDLLASLDEGSGTLLLLKVTASVVRHVHRLKVRLLYWRFYKKPGVSYERLTAVAAAYTYPRRVRIISFKSDSDYNYIFPMDLLADIRQSGIYLLGMRHSNQVLARIAEQKRIVVSEVPAEHKALIYKLGRNHSASPPPLEQLPFTTIVSKEFGFRIPEWAQSYKEIHIHRTLDVGSHMLLLGHCAEGTVLGPPVPHLHHIHFLHHLYMKSKGFEYPVV